MTQRCLPQLREAHEVLASGAAQILPENGLAERLLAADREQRPLRVKLGIDPSGVDLTLGHAVVLRKLRQFQDFGHTAVLVVGGFTGQVGDPSGRTTTRVAHSADEVIANAKGYFDQLMRILDRDRTEVVNNADWLGTMQVAELLDYTRQITVAQLLERDDFARRFAAHQPISLSEFIYPLLQGIDSVEIRADIELGGTDQTFNNLVGRELQRSRGQAPQAVLTVPLLVGTDGVEKMGKSLDNYIAINDTADEQFGKLMSIPDSIVGLYAQLCAGLHPREAEQIERDVTAGGSAANTAKRRVAREIVDAVPRRGAGNSRRATVRRDPQARRAACRCARVCLARRRIRPRAQGAEIRRPGRELERGTPGDRRGGGSHRRAAARGQAVRPARRTPRGVGADGWQAQRGAAAPPQ